MNRVHYLLLQILNISEDKCLFPRVLQSIFSFLLIFYLIRYPPPPVRHICFASRRSTTPCWTHFHIQVGYREIPHLFTTAFFCEHGGVDGFVHYIILTSCENVNRPNSIFICTLWAYMRQLKNALIPQLAFIHACSPNLSDEAVADYLKVGGGGCVMFCGFFFWFFVCESRVVIQKIGFCSIFSRLTHIVRDLCQSLESFKLK